MPVLRHRLLLADLLARLVPPPQTPRWGMATTCRIQLRPTGEGLCGALPCDVALLLDAAPGAPGRG